MTDYTPLLGAAVNTTCPGHRHTASHDSIKSVVRRWLEADAGALGDFLPQKVVHLL
jgi:hypothetical protein